jgi:hypothetical protein
MPYTPNLAARLRPGRAIAVALALGLVVATFRAGPDPAVAVEALPAIRGVAATPDANAADLVGIYRSATACMLTLDASGTYISDCAGRRASRYATSGDQVVLQQPIGGVQRLAISGPGRLVAADGTIFSITGGTR